MRSRYRVPAPARPRPLLSPTARRVRHQAARYRSGRSTCWPFSARLMVASSCASFSISRSRNTGREIDQCPSSPESSSASLRPGRSRFQLLVGVVNVELGFIGDERRSSVLAVIVTGIRQTGQFTGFARLEAGGMMVGEDLAVVR